MGCGIQHEGYYGFYGRIITVMNEKITINKSITKHTTATSGFRPSKSELHGTQNNNSEFIGSLRKPRKKRYARAFG